MAAKSEEHRVKVSGPGLSLDRAVEPEIAHRVVSLVMTGKEESGKSRTDTNADGGTFSGRGVPSGVTSRDFLAQKRPGNDYERVACLAYYLAKVDNLTQFKTADITRISKASALHITNHSLAVQHAANSYRYLASAGRGVKQLTPLGEAVVDALPDREKVKTAIAELKPKQRRKAGRKKRK